MGGRAVSLDTAGMNPLRTAAIQMCSTADVARNLRVAEALVARAAAGAAKLVVLPENFAFLAEREGEKMVIAESLQAPSSGPIASALRDWAVRYGVWIVGGGLAERTADDARRAFNTALVIDPRGHEVARYRKVHLFDVDIPGGAVLRESDATLPGETPIVVAVDGTRVGLSICYDLRFPELYRQLAYDMGADVLLVPAAFTAHTGKAHWHVLLRARAIENQAWVVAAAQWGQHNPKRESFGHSMIVDPWGTVVEELPGQDGMIIADIDSAAAARVRQQMPCRSHAALWRKAATSP